MSFTTRPEIRGTTGVIATTHWLATMAGWRMFELGGNAFDAAVAAGFALQVVEPHQNGLGGDMPAVFHSARSGRAEVVCGQGVAPAAASLARFEALGLDLIPGTGLLAAVVPGAFDAWMLLLRDHGSLGLRQVLEPAIAYATDGFIVSPSLHTVIANMAALFTSEWPGSAAIHLDGGAAPAAGGLHRNPVLADTYARLVREGEAAGKGKREREIEGARRAYYEGFVAETIDAFCRTTECLDATGRRHGALLTGDDMARWRAEYEAPATVEYAGFTVCKCGPWSQGPVMLQQLALLEGFDLGAMDPLGSDFVHAQVEAAKLAMADREAWYGDPAASEVPLDDLLSDAYNTERRALIGETASLELRPGRPGGRQPHLARLADFVAERTGGPRRYPAGAAISGIGEPNRSLAGAANPMPLDPADGDTVHVDAADRHGNMISCMPSGGWLQASPAISELGFCLGTRAQMFWLEDGLASSLRPGTRPRTTLSPGLALRDGAPVLAFGTPGGDQQDQWALTLFLRHVHHGLNLAEAVDAPMFHSESFPSSFYPRCSRPGVLSVESRLPAATVDELARRGHRVEEVGDWALGRLTAVGRAAGANGNIILKAAANPRFQQGYAVGR